MSEFGVSPERSNKMSRDRKVDILISRLDPERAVKTGEATGREALEWLAENGDYVFHGSDRKLLELEPRQQMQFNPKTGKMFQAENQRSVPPGV